MLDGRKVEFLNIQRNFRASYLNRCMKAASVKALGDKIKAVNNVKSTAGEYANEYFTFGTKKYPLDVWKTVYNVEIHNYAEIVRNEEYLRKALINYKLSEDKIREIIETGKYIKELPK